MHLNNSHIRIVQKSGLSEEASKGTDKRGHSRGFKLSNQDFLNPRLFFNAYSEKSTHIFAAASTSPAA